MSSATIDSDLVTDLKTETKYDLDWYSGMLDISTDDIKAAAHYFFFPSQNDSTKDPLLLWLNGNKKNIFSIYLNRIINNIFLYIIFI